VVGGKALSSSLKNEQKIVTVQGRKVTVTINANGVFINNSKVTVADIQAENGVVHVIDAVLLPPTIPATVADIVINSANHNTLEAAVVAAGLVGTLQGDGPFTVFAPTDAAFAALPAGTVEALLKDIPALKNILTYHVVGAKALSSSLKNEQKIVTVQGRKVTVTINANGVFINNAKVTVADIQAENGVVHVIDAVLLPSTTTNISTLDEVKFDIYPNPASEFITINSEKGIESLIIRDIAGRVVNQLYNLSTSERIELNGYKSGMYLVSMKNGNSVSTKKLIIR
jgi:uncharacterized surface protein with fasciclin (FAS1) repeats